ncbi:hypothetical protein T05_528 [Trichinella murrelli]|uniref:Uncharacterized protein n=1 Tax=Trichinella murrelli TaxID=144512 RepID=A0A0V0T749_9BILA|nr:hypothetical protein T05_528 [Trichinella murrelli]
MKVESNTFNQKTSTMPMPMFGESVSVAAKECPFTCATSRAPSCQFSSASDARNLPVFCAGTFSSTLLEKPLSCAVSTKHEKIKIFHKFGIKHNETYQSASLAPALFLHLEISEIVMSGSSKSIRTNVSILKHLFV